MSISELLVPNKYQIYDQGRTLKSADFTLTSAQILAGTTITVVTPAAGTLLALDKVLVNYNYGGVAYTGAAVMNIVAADISTPILTNADLLDNKNVVSWYSNSTLQSVDAAQVAPIQVAPSAVSGAGNGTITGTVWYYEVSA